MRYRSKQALVASIEAEHDALCARLDAIPRSRHRDRGVWGDDWTVCDLVAHLAEWQAMFLTWYDDGVRGLRPSMPAPGYKWNETPKLNRAIWARHRRRSAASVRAQFDAGYRTILELVARLDEEALLLPGRFSWTGRSPLTTYLGANTASHYRFAVKVLKRWQATLADTGGSRRLRR
jgi:hypothetical protein